jgi:YYY domain-containing protein
MSFLPDAVRWYLTLVVATWALAPIARLALGRLPSRGAFIARPLALLAVIWPSWFLASVSPIPYATVGLWAAVVILGLLGWGLTLRKREPLRDWLRLLLVAEAISLVAFAGYAIARGYAPNIAGTEKPMDAALFAANRRATDMPPADPWMAGEKLNYYYLGYTIHGSVARMSGVSTWVGFNLALASTFAMAVCAAAGLAWDAVRVWFGPRLAAAGAFFGAFFVMFAGNMYTPVRLLEHPERVWQTWWWGGIGWNASRVVMDAKPGDTINEFPAFSFVLGDLHPHVSALPFTILALTLALNFLLTPRNAASPTAFSRWPGLILAGAAIGSLYPMNSWDFPTYLAAALIAIGLSLGWTRRALIAGVFVVGASVLAWAPFIVTFVPFATGSEQDLPAYLRGIPGVSSALKQIAFYRGERTSAGEFLTMFGMPWLIAMIYFAVRLIRQTGDGAELRVPKSIVVAGGITAVIAIAWPAPVLLLAGIPLVCGVWLLCQNRERGFGLDSLVSLLFAAGFGLILLTEFFYLHDIFGGRMNTLFKVYYQAWTMTGIASALAIVSLWLVVEERLVWGTLLRAAAVVAVAAGLTYPVISERAWMRYEAPVRWKGLDGAAFIQNVAPGDLAAIEWLTNHAKTNDVILEAPGCSYEVNGSYPTSGVAAFTGVPTILGWWFHEVQWRGGQPDLLAQVQWTSEPPLRAQDAAAMYADPSSPLFAKYGVTLLYIGKYETEGATGCSIAGPYDNVTAPTYPGPGWTLIFENDGARIYRETS